MSLFGLSKTGLAQFARMAQATVASGHPCVVGENDEGISCHIDLGASYAQPHEDTDPSILNTANATRISVARNDHGEFDIAQTQSNVEACVGFILGHAAAEAQKQHAPVDFYFGFQEDEPGKIFLDVNRGAVAEIPFKIIGQKIDELESLVMDGWKKTNEAGVLTKQFKSDEERQNVLEVIANLSEAFGLDNIVYDHVHQTKSGFGILMTEQFLSELRAREAHIELY